MGDMIRASSGDLLVDGQDFSLFLAPFLKSPDKVLCRIVPLDLFRKDS
jgi:hypothetical protein